MNRPGEDIAVIMLGYEKQMKKMLRDQNPGLSNRFALESALRFEDYDDTELLRILKLYCRKEGVSAPLRIARRAVRHISRRRYLPNFGNARLVKNMISKAIRDARARCSKSMSQPQKSARRGKIVLTLEDLVGKEALEAESESPFAALDSLFNAEEVCRQLRRLESIIKQYGPHRTEFLGNWLFLGQPGTGKTTVARVMAKVLHKLKVLATPNCIETTADDLTGQYLGQTKDKVKEKMREAMGGVLFVDEAYALGRGQFGTEAMTSLLHLLTLDDYRDGKTVVIMAGYKKDMHDMLRRNAGMASRFKKRLEFPDWSPATCAEFIRDRAGKDGFRIGDAAHRELVMVFDQLTDRPGWANARDADSMLTQLMEERALRLSGADEQIASFTFEDAQAAGATFLRHRPAGQSRADADELATMRLDSMVVQSPRAMVATQHQHQHREFEQNHTQRQQRRHRRRSLPAQTLPMHLALTDGGSGDGDAEKLEEEDGDVAAARPPAEMWLSKGLGRCGDLEQSLNVLSDFVGPTGSGNLREDVLAAARAAAGAGVTEQDLLPALRGEARKALERVKEKMESIRQEEDVARRADLERKKARQRAQELQQEYDREKEEEERRRLEEERKRMLEEARRREIEAKRARHRAKMMSMCPAGFGWTNVGSGLWICNAWGPGQGSHRYREQD